MTEMEKALGRARQPILESVAHTGKRVLILRTSRGSDKSTKRNYEIAKAVADGVFTELVRGETKDRLGKALFEAASMPGQTIAISSIEVGETHLNERVEKIMKGFQQFKFLGPKVVFGEKTLVEFGNGSKVIIVAARTGGVRDERS